MCRPQQPISAWKSKGGAGLGLAIPEIAVAGKTEQSLGAAAAEYVMGQALSNGNARVCIFGEKNCCKVV